MLARLWASVSRVDVLARIGHVGRDHELPEESLRKKEVPVMLVPVMASLKVTLTGVPKLAPVVPFAGVTD